jgi:hypothetical protein
MGSAPDVRTLAPDPLPQALQEARQRRAAATGRLDSRSDSGHQDDNEPAKALVAEEL